MIVELQTVWKEAVVAYSRYSPDISLEEMNDENIA
jgi:hypothetical protein